MNRKVNSFVGSIVILALAGGVSLYIANPAIESAHVRAIVLLSTLAIVAEMLAFLLPRAARGSIAFIPYLATVVTVPSWSSVAAIVIVKTITELTVPRVRRIQAVFNIAQHALTLSTAIWVFKLSGGESMLSLPSHGIGDVTMRIGAPAMLAFASSFVLNTFLVSTAIALSNGSTISSVWRANNLATIGIDLMAGPLVFTFAWVYAAYGPIAAATIWVPILGLRQVHKTNLELEQTNQELLELMVKSIEARDPYTSGHSRRVQHYSIIVARAMGLREREIEGIGRAALLHDVGKIYEKYAPILVKPEKLTPDEWTTMQEHPIDGANLVATMSKLKDVVPAVRHHHENWDGTGYPDGLAGEAIPLASRIIMFADTIDAMTTERPYRGPLNEAQVRAELIRCRGQQFDPQICDQLLASPLWKTLFNAHRAQTPRRGIALVKRTVNST